MLLFAFLNFAGFHIFSCCREGFEQERLEALLHKIELGQKHQTNNFGFHLAIVSEGVTEWEGEWVGLLEG